jgi:hypothetical protein
MTDFEFWTIMAISGLSLVISGFSLGMTIATRLNVKTFCQQERKPA